MGSASSSTAPSTASQSPPPPVNDANKHGAAAFGRDHLTNRPDDFLLRILLSLPPAETGDLLCTCASLSNLAPLAWRLKAQAAAEAAVGEGGQPLLLVEDDDRSRGAGHWRNEFARALKRRICTRPKIDALGEPPHWYPSHPEPSSPFGVVARCHDVTEFCVTAKSRVLGEGTYTVRWRVCSTSGFCVLQLAHTVVSPDRRRSAISSGVWNTKDDRGSGWKMVTTVGSGTVQVGPEGGVVEGRMFKQDLEFAGGLLVDYMEVNKLESVEPPRLLQSTLLTSNW